MSLVLIKQNSELIMYCFYAIDTKIRLVEEFHYRRSKVIKPYLICVLAL